MRDEHQDAQVVDLVIIGAGMGGLSAAIVAANAGLDATVIEAGEKVGGAAAYSGGQVWVGGNHIARERGIEDSVEDALAYVRWAASKDLASLDEERSREWLSTAAEAAEYFERTGVIAWDVVPDYPDYYYPHADGSVPTGRYLTSSPYDGHQLGEDFDRMFVSPHFPVGVTYDEMLSWGGMSSKTAWDTELVAQRRQERVLTFGTGIAAPFFKAVLDRGVPVLTEHRAVGIEREGDRFRVTSQTPEGMHRVLARSVIVASGAHDWSVELMEEFTGITPADGGTVVPPSVRGDAQGLVEPFGGETAKLPPSAAPVLPGYRLEQAAFPGDTGYRACYEHCLPHTVIVDETGSRFADDSFHSAIVREVLGDGTTKPRFPIFMVWDEQHHQKYGLGPALPGGEYPEGLVVSADSLQELGEALGIDGVALESTVDRYNTGAVEGEDPDFGRGSNLSVRRFRGDGNQQPNPCVGPLLKAPFHGMRMRLLSTGIAASGVMTGEAGRLLDSAGAEVPGLYVVGEASARAAAGVGYNSGYSLSRAMAYGYLAVHDIVQKNGSQVPVAATRGRK